MQVFLTKSKNIGISSFFYNQAINYSNETNIKSTKANDSAALFCPQGAMFIKVTWYHYQLLLSPKIGSPCRRFSHLDALLYASTRFVVVYYDIRILWWIFVSVLPNTEGMDVDRYDQNISLRFCSLIEQLLICAHSCNV